MWEKFEHLLEQNVPIKVRISSPAISQIVQQLAFKKDYKWSEHGRKISFTDKPYLFFEEDKLICYSDSESHFKHYDLNLEYDFKKDCLIDKEGYFFWHYKKMLDDGKPFKIHHSSWVYKNESFFEAIQQIAFNRGYRWYDKEKYLISSRLFFAYDLYFNVSEHSRISNCEGCSFRWTCKRWKNIPSLNYDTILEELGKGRKGLPYDDIIVLNNGSCFYLSDPGNLRFPTDFRLYPNALKISPSKEGKERFAENMYPYQRFECLMKDLHRLIKCQDYIPIKKVKYYNQLLKKIK